jgi:GNAT superfamily N-acetyltransferase
MTVVLRTGEPKDYGYCLTSWVESLRAALAPDAKARAWSDALSEAVARRLRAGSIVVACDSDDEDRLYGFACVERGVLRYVYTRSTRRGAGLAARMLEALGSPKECATMTPELVAAAARHGIRWR